MQVQSFNSLLAFRCSGFIRAGRWAKKVGFFQQSLEGKVVFEICGFAFVWVSG